MSKTDPAKRFVMEDGQAQITPNPLAKPKEKK
jgi:hypothetical protein